MMYILHTVCRKLTDADVTSPPKRPHPLADVIAPPKRPHPLAEVDVPCKTFSEISVRDNSLACEWYCVHVKFDQNALLQSIVFSQNVFEPNSADNDTI